MSRFYSSCQGNRGMATRCGHSHINVSAQSFEGSIVVSMHIENDTIIVGISAQPGSCKTHTISGTQLYWGPLADLFSEDGRAAIVRTFAHKELEKSYAKGA